MDLFRYNNGNIGIQSENVKISLTDLYQKGSQQFQLLQRVLDKERNFTQEELAILREIDTIFDIIQIQELLSSH